MNKQDKTHLPLLAWLMVLLPLALMAITANTTSGFVKSAQAPTRLAVGKGEKIVFMGDSITEDGQSSENGYVNLVMRALNQQGLELTHMGAGVSGQKSNDMLAWIETDVFRHKPQWLILSCGVNDVWHFKLRLGDLDLRGVQLEDYKKNIAAIIKKAQAADIKVMILTATMIDEDPEREINKDMIPYNEFLSKIAKEKNCLLADLNGDMRKTLAAMPDVKGPAKMFGERGYKRDIRNKLTTDGCHMNKLGNIMMAKGILRAFGLTDDKIAAAEKSWSEEGKPAPAGQ
jgi:lysophospholipase L1-like esterase